MGYLYNKKRNYWEVREKVDGVRKYLGSFPSELEARRASWKAVISEDKKRYTLERYELKLEQIEHQMVFLRPIKRAFAWIWRKRQIKKAKRLLLPQSEQ